MALWAGKLLKRRARQGNGHPKFSKCHQLSRSSHSHVFRSQIQISEQLPLEHTCLSRAHSSGQDRITGNINRADCFYRNFTLCRKEVGTWTGTGFPLGEKSGLF